MWKKGLIYSITQQQKRFRENAENAVFISNRCERCLINYQLPRTRLIALKLDSIEIDELSQSKQFYVRRIQ